METSYPVSWELLNRLHTENKPHRYFDPRVELPAGADVGVGEALMHSGVAHHVLDLTGIPALDGYGHDLDARVLQLVTAYLEVASKLARVADVHSRETGAGGTVGDFCTECGWRWPCHSHRIATGTVDDE